MKFLVSKIISTKPRLRHGYLIELKLLELKQKNNELPYSSYWESNFEN